MSSCCRWPPGEENDLLVQVSTTSRVVLRLTDEARRSTPGAGWVSRQPNQWTGYDLLVGSEGPDILRGELGNDFLSGRGGADLLIGDQGRDVLRAGLGRDRLLPRTVGCERIKL